MPLELVRLESSSCTLASPLLSPLPSLFAFPRPLHSCRVVLRVDYQRLTTPIFPGRTTFVNTLCGKSVLSHKESDDPNIAHTEEGVKIKPITVGMCFASALPSTGMPWPNCHDI